VPDLEDRLRRELRELAQRAQPGSIRPLAEREPRGRSRRLRWLAPLSAATAVLAVVAAVSFVGPAGGQRSGTAPPVLAGQAGPMPKYYVAVYQRYVGPQGRITTTAAVHASATGATLTTVPVPTLFSDGGTQGPSISAAADDRTFIITELAQGAHNITWFFRLHLGANGRAASLTKLSVTVPSSLSVDDVALSPDASKLAISVQSCHGGSCQYSGVRLVTLATGAVNTWTTRANGAPFNTFWAGNTRVGFQWQSGSRTPPAREGTGYRLLNIAAPGRDLLSATPIGSSGAEPSGFIPAALVTSDGTVVITSTVRNVRQWYFRDTVVGQFIELSARTGHLLGVLYTSSQKFVSPGINGAGQLDQECNVVSLASVGIHALVQCFGLGFGRLDGTKFTPLQAFPSPSSSGVSGQSAAAW
jgi:hypothetical protein